MADRFASLDMHTGVTSWAVWSDGRLLGDGRTIVPRQAGSPVAHLQELVSDLHERFAPDGWGLCSSGVLQDERLTSSSLGVRDLDLRVACQAIGFEPDVLLGRLHGQALGEADNGESLALLVVGEGVGAQVIEQGAIVRGAGAGGEIGHWQFDPSGPRCRCGRRGCLETLLGWWAVRRQWQEAGGAPSSGPEGLGDAAVAGHPHAQEILGNASWGLGVALSLLVAVADPPRICLSGVMVDTLGDQLWLPALAELRQRSWGEREPQIGTSRWHNFAAHRGLARSAGVAVPDDPQQLLDGFWAARG